jgi:hypothetical protein
VVEEAGEKRTPRKRRVDRERPGAGLEVQENLHAPAGRQSLYDALQHASLIRRDPDELKACLVAELPFPVGILRRAND